MPPGQDPEDVVHELDSGDRVRFHFADMTGSHKFQPDDPFTTTVKWVHRDTDLDSLITTYRAEFEPDPADPDADHYFMKRHRPLRDGVEVTPLMAEKRVSGGEQTWRIEVVESIEVNP